MGPTLGRRASRSFISETAVSDRTVSSGAMLQTAIPRMSAWAISVAREVKSTLPPLADDDDGLVGGQHREISRQVHTAIFSRPPKSRRLRHTSGRGGIGHRHTTAQLPPEQLAHLR